MVAEDGRPGGESAAAQREAAATAGAQLRANRVRTGLAPEALAARAGMDESRLHRIEAGNDRMSVQELMQFADIFKVSVSSFFEPARPAPRPRQPAGQPAGQLAGLAGLAERGGPERPKASGRGASQAAQTGGATGGASDGSADGAGGASDGSGTGVKNVAADTALAADVIAQFGRIRDRGLREALVNLLQVSMHRG